MKKSFIGILGLAVLTGSYIVAAESFTKPRKEKKCSDAQVREHICRDLGQAVKSGFSLQSTLADLGNYGLSIVEDVVDGCACPLARQKGKELKDIALQVQHYAQRMQALADELEGYKKLLKSMQATT